MCCSFGCTVDKGTRTSPSASGMCIFIRRLLLLRGGGANQESKNTLKNIHTPPLSLHNSLIAAAARTPPICFKIRAPMSNQGLQPSMLVSFRVGIDVDITELRHRSLGPLASLELEAPPPPSTPSAVVGSTGSPRGDDTSSCSPNSPNWAAVRRRSQSPSQSKSITVRPALRMCSAAANSYSIQTRPTGQGSSSTGTTKNLLEGWRRPWSPATSPVMSKMKREGFAVHDVSTTVGGGFYLERPLLSWGRFQGHSGGAVWECGARGGQQQQQQCQEYSGTGEFSTASLPPRFASFVVGGVPQVGQVFFRLTLLAT